MHLIKSIHTSINVTMLSLREKLPAVPLTINLAYRGVNQAVSLSAVVLMKESQLAQIYLLSTIILTLVAIVNSTSLTCNAYYTQGALIRFEFMYLN